MKRRFEFVGVNSAKFWQVTVSGLGVTVSYGRLGTAGQSQAKIFQDAAAASKHAEQQIRQKLAKGYRETAVV